MSQRQYNKISLLILLLKVLATVQIIGRANALDLAANNSSQMNESSPTSGRSMNLKEATLKQESSRSGRMLNLDRVAGEVSGNKEESLASGTRQSRKLSELASYSVEERSKGGKKMSIKGFIPIVSLDGSNDSKQLESLAEHFSSDSDQSEEPQEGSGQEAAGNLREQIQSNFGAQTSIGHASFAPTTAQQQAQTDSASDRQNQWQTPSEISETGRARKLLSSNIFAGHRPGLRPLASGLMSSLIPHPSSLSPGQQQSALMQPMNLPPTFASQNPLMMMGHQLNPHQQQLVASAAERAEQCVCVPFYQCKNGHLVDSHPSKSYQTPHSIQVPRSLDNQQQQYASQPGDQQMVNDIYEQLRKSIESQNLEKELLLQQQQQQQTGLIDERNANTSSTNDVEERSLFSANRRQSSVSGRHCGIMRTCCKIAPNQFTNEPNHFQQQQMPSAHQGRLIQRPPAAQYQLLSPHRSQVAASHQFQTPMIQSIVEQPLASSSLNQEFLAAASSPQRQTSSFMSGRCGTRQTLGISGRVQNAQAQAQGEQVEADFGEFPAHAAILRRLSPGDSLFVCSAVLVSSQWLATAAHCVRKLRADELKVRLGEWDVSRDDEFYPHLESNVRDIVLHPDFQQSSLANDLALVRLEQPLELGEQVPHISPACLAQPEQQFAGQRCWLAGWGKDAFGRAGAFQSTLRKVDLPVINRHDCELALRHQTKLGKYFRLHANNICAGGERGKDACEGDGGAGLYCLDAATGLSRALGLVSWGVGCGQRGVPGVYVNLANFNAWIEQVVASSGEENLYPSSAELAARQQQQAPSSDAFRSIISERSNSNGTLVAQLEKQQVAASSQQ